MKGLAGCTVALHGGEWCRQYVLARGKGLLQLYRRLRSKAVEDRGCCSHVSEQQLTYFALVTGRLGAAWVGGALHCI